jgi:hypothetical protein
MGRNSCYFLYSTPPQATYSTFLFEACPRYKSKLKETFFTAMCNFCLGHTVEHRRASGPSGQAQGHTRDANRIYNHTHLTCIPSEMVQALCLPRPAFPSCDLPKMAVSRLTVAARALVSVLLVLARSYLVVLDVGGRTGRGKGRQEC